jgi:hypothetical protein
LAAGWWGLSGLAATVGGLFVMTFAALLCRGVARRDLGLVGVALGFLAIPFIWVQGLATIWSLLLSLVVLAVMVDAGRMYAARFTHDNQMRKTGRDTAALAVVLMAFFGLSLIVPTAYALWTVVGLALVLAVYGLFRVIFAYRKYSFPVVTAGDKLPTLTLAIPARNETTALADCLLAAGASDYQKLEIIVLDDCSQDRTSAVIRSFAHDGVQFIQGDRPADGWLGKNYAMRQLARRANGDFIAFMGVDTRLSPDSLTQIMNLMTARDLDMVSILPRNNYAWHPSGLMETLRGFWQVILPPTQWRTPVIGSLWIIRRQALADLGGFAAQKYKIVPENAFARAMIKSKKYRFFVGNHNLGIMAAKKWTSQVETAVRVICPTLHRRPLEALAAILLDLLLLAPYILLIGQLAGGVLDALGFTALTAAVLTSLVATLTAGLSRNSWLIAMISFPLQLAQDIVLTMLSTLAYEFGEVNWKSRNVCYPVMTVGKSSGNNG